MSDSKDPNTRRGLVRVVFDVAKTGTPATVLSSARYHGYVDETAADARSPIKLVGAAVLVTGSPIAEGIIETALSHLDADPDRHRADRRAQDDRTLKRGYFHASEDSANAHSHLCKAIRETVQGVVAYHLFDMDKLEPWRRAQTENGLQNAAFSLSAYLPLRQATPVSFIVEARRGQGDLRKRWLESFLMGLEWAIYDMPLQPILFPQIDISIGAKRMAGLQVVDFLLWALNRGLQHVTDPWAERVGLRLDHTTAQQDGPMNTGLYSLGAGRLKLPTPTYPAPVLPLPEYTGRDKIGNALILMERCVRFWYARLPDHSAHLHGVLVIAMKGLANEQFASSAQSIERIASAFLRIFDTVPIYAQASEEDIDLWHRMLGAKRLASLVLRKDLVHGQATLAYMARFRQWLSENQPEVLDVEREAR